MITIIDLFSGAGGLTEGFRNENYELIAHVEMDSQACKTLQARDAFYYLKSNNQLEIYKKYLNNEITLSEFLNLVPKSVTDKVINLAISEENLSQIFSEIDVKRSDKKINGIIGGPPCQAYSTIGRAQNERIKHRDTRIYLYQYYTLFLKQYEPDFFIFENVKGLLSFKDLDGTNLLPKIKKAFENSLPKSGYHIDYKIVNSADYGVPQKRERLIIFGYKKDYSRVNFFESLKKYEETPPTINQLFKDLPILESGQTLNIYNESKPAKYVDNHIRNFELPLTQNIARKNNSNDLEIYKIVAKEKLKKNNVRYPDLPSKLIKHKNANIFLDRFKAIDGTSVCHTVVAHISKDGHYYIHPDFKQNRSITVREAARIQTFPDDFYFENSRTAAFRQIGNAVPPYLSKALSQTIIDVLYK
ncbi:DNA cytosine methyltransferase [Vagococcus sp. BWB3-3]|uniref:Cytosine-specific methyltransferase n=1 Tax=Vagococcus allomyrinae TaxID=2794353 RepID=A0A940PGD3_9ENTE|nr:DNA cytosine methyltransferase [Vagococcus allomyrinae]MBP1042383.1 DNA cytosine methyltransferase [Vagococcus allomyrinae]